MRGGGARPFQHSGGSQRGAAPLKNYYPTFLAPAILNGNAHAK
jgi:hypothetical protein